MDEIWLPVPGFEGWLEVSSLCRVRTVDYEAPSTRKHQPVQTKKSTLLSPWLSKSGYWTVSMKRGDKRPKRFVHVLAARAFVPGWFEGATVDHLDGCKSHNAIDNFEWVTKAENSRRQNADGRGVPKGERHPGAKLADADVPLLIAMRKTGLSLEKVGEHFGVSGSLVHKIENGRRRRQSL